MPTIASRAHCDGPRSPADFAQRGHCDDPSPQPRSTREYFERAKARTALTSIACLIATACAAATTDATPDASATASAANTASAATSASTAAAPSASGTPSAAPLSEEERERQNEGCKYRKSTGKLTKCEAVKKGPALSAKELGEAVKLAKYACYCVDDLPALVDQCMTKAGSGSVKLTVGTLDDPTDCTLTITSADVSGRRFARFKADVRDVATFYATISVHEVRAGKTERIFDGFNDVDPAEVKGWSKLPEPIQRWMKED